MFGYLPQRSEICLVPLSWVKKVQDSVKEPILVLWGVVPAHPFCWEVKETLNELGVALNTPRGCSTQAADCRFWGWMLVGWVLPGSVQG